MDAIGRNSKPEGERPWYLGTPKFGGMSNGQTPLPPLPLAPIEMPSSTSQTVGTSADNDAIDGQLDLIALMEDWQDGG